jgi:indole-3-glycerol phosphate synthase
VSSILDEILAHKRQEVAQALERVSRDEMATRAAEAAEPTRGFLRAIEEHSPPAVIAEIKRKSPSKGLIRPDLDPVACGRAYHRGGAACISVLTDEHYFGGALSFLQQVRKVVPLPLLRKDFVVDEYQIDEARVAGADAVLLIVAALSAAELVAFRERADALGLDSLIEVHNEAELDIALDAGATLLGVNNRDLRTFHTDLAVTERLAARLAKTSGGLPSSVRLVAESGIHSSEDVERLQGAGAVAFLVGESLMREVDPARALERLRGSAG